MPSLAGPTQPDRRPAIIAGLAAVTVLAWLYVIHVAGMPGMSGNPMDMPGMDMPGMATPTALPSIWLTFWALFAMWIAMMVGMMLPSVLPTVLLYAAIAQKRRDSGRAPLSVSAFVSGYLLAWVGFSLVAAGLQTRFQAALLPRAALSRTDAIAAGVLLLVTGAYQWTRFKASCLSHCRSPISHLSLHWSEGVGGALRMGMYHGALCLGCCWLLMGLLFVGGVMNPYWIGGLTVLVLVEKVIPRGDLVGRVAGLVLIGWGLLLILPP